MWGRHRRLLLPVRGVARDDRRRLTHPTISRDLIDLRSTSNLVSEIFCVRVCRESCWRAVQIGTSAHAEMCNSFMQPVGFCLTRFRQVTYRFHYVRQLLLLLLHSFNAGANHTCHPLKNIKTHTQLFELYCGQTDRKGEYIISTKVGGGKKNMNTRQLMKS